MALRRRERGDCLLGVDTFPRSFIIRSSTCNIPLPLLTCNADLARSSSLSTDAILLPFLLLIHSFPSSFLRSVNSLRQHHNNHRTPSDNQTILRIIIEESATEEAIKEYAIGPRLRDKTHDLSGGFACACPRMFTFCSLLGAQSESSASQSLLELDGGVKLLIDVGWDESFDAEKLQELEK